MSVSENVNANDSKENKFPTSSHFLCSKCIILKSLVFHQLCSYSFQFCCLNKMMQCSRTSTSKNHHTCFLKQAGCANLLSEWHWVGNITQLRYQHSIQKRNMLCRKEDFGSSSWKQINPELRDTAWTRSSPGLSRLVGGEKKIQAVQKGPKLCTEARAANVNNVSI